jgi:tellurite resistance protein
MASTAAPAAGLPRIPASFFGMVLGLAGLANAWRSSAPAWGLPAGVAPVLALMATLVWAILLALFVLKWLLARRDALEEAAHPVQCCFIGLAGVSTMLIAGGALPYARDLALVLFALGAAFTLGFAAWRTGRLWQGGRDPSSSTPVLYLPSVAGGFVTGTVAAALGYPEAGQLAFGAGLFAWLAIESVLLHRYYTGVPMPAPLRPTLGIQLAPPCVGAVSYLAVNGGQPDLLAHALVGYGVLQALILLRLAGWIRQQPFGASYWAFTFGATALATASARLSAATTDAVVRAVAVLAFAGANLLVAAVAVGTLRLMLQGRLLPPPPAGPAPPPADGASPSR